MFAAKAREESLVVFESLRMPPKSTKKRQREGNLEKAREEKRRRSAGESSTEIAESGAASHEDDVNDMADLLDVSIHELDTDNEDIDPSFDLDASMKSGIVWSREDLNKTATKYIRENADVKGKPNLTLGTICNWINEYLLPNETLEPGFRRKISMETGSTLLGLMLYQRRREHLLMGTNVMMLLSTAPSSCVEWLVWAF